MLVDIISVRNKFPRITKHSFLGRVPQAIRVGPTDTKRNFSHLLPGYQMATLVIMFTK